MQQFSPTGSQFRTTIEPLVYYEYGARLRAWVFRRLQHSLVLLHQPLFCCTSQKGSTDRIKPRLSARDHYHIDLFFKVMPNIAFSSNYIISHSSEHTSSCHRTFTNQDLRLHKVLRVTPRYISVVMARSRRCVGGCLMDEGSCTVTKMHNPPHTVVRLKL